MAKLSWDSLIELANDVPFRSIYTSCGLEFRRSEGDTQCKCPFHGQDRHPSARIYDSTNSFHCFTCGFSKSPVGFIKLITGKSLTESVHYIISSFRSDLLKIYDAIPEITLDSVKTAYLEHLSSTPGLNAQVGLMQAIQLPGQFTNQKQSPFDARVYHSVTRLLWRHIYHDTDFRQLYSEFTRLLWSQDPAQLNTFVSSLRTRVLASGQQ